VEDPASEALQAKPSARMQSIRDAEEILRRSGGPTSGVGSIVLAHGHDRRPYGRRVPPRFLPSQMRSWVA